MKKQDNSKKMLFEAMHKVAGMPLREDIYGNDNQNISSPTKTLWTGVVIDNNNPNAPKQTINMVAKNKQAVHDYVRRQKPYNYVTNLTSRQVTDDELSSMDAEQEAGNEKPEDMFEEFDIHSDDFNDDFDGWVKNFEKGFKDIPDDKIMMLAQKFVDSEYSKDLMGLNKFIHDNYRKLYLKPETMSKLIDKIGNPDLKNQWVQLSENDGGYSPLQDPQRPLQKEEFIAAMEKFQENDKEALKKMNPEEPWYNFFVQGIEGRQKVIDSAKKQSGGGLSENDNDLNEWTIINDYNLPSYKSYGNDPEFKEIVESMSLIEGPVDEFGALIGYLDYAKANGISDTSKHAEIVLDVLNYFRKRGGEIPNDPNASGSREY